MLTNEPYCVIELTNVLIKTIKLWKWLAIFRIFFLSVQNI